MLTSGIEEIGVISPTKLNFPVRGVCSGMFCLDEEVVFTHSDSKEVDKTGPSKLSLVYTRGKL